MSVFGGRNCCFRWLRLLRQMLVCVDGLQLGEAMSLNWLRGVLVFIAGGMHMMPKSFA